MTHPELRPAAAADVATIVGIFARSRAACLPFLPVLHSTDEDMAFFAHYLDGGRITLAQADGAVLGFIAEMPGWIEQLYLEPSQLHRGIGHLLVEDVKTRHANLELWCFAENAAALRFYAKQGFRQIGRTDGDNEAGLPDILLAWKR